MRFGDRAAELIRASRNFRQWAESAPAAGAHAPHDSAFVIGWPVADRLR